MVTLVHEGGYVRAVPPYIGVSFKPIVFGWRCGVFMVWGFGVGATGDGSRVCRMAVWYLYPGNGGPFPCTYYRGYTTVDGILAKIMEK